MSGLHSRSCSMSFYALHAWNSGGELILSPRRARLAQARIPAACLGCCLEHSPRWGAAFWATGQLAQARQPRLSEGSWNFPRPTVVGSPKREPVAWARQLLSWWRIILFPFRVMNMVKLFKKAFWKFPLDIKIACYLDVKVHFSSSWKEEESWIQA